VKDKTVLVTGSSGLIGSEAVEHFDRQGRCVVGVVELRGPGAQGRPHLLHLQPEEVPEGLSQLAHYRGARRNLETDRRIPGAAPVRGARRARRNMKREHWARQFAEIVGGLREAAVCFSGNLGNAWE